MGQITMDDNLAFHVQVLTSGDGAGAVLRIKPLEVGAVVEVPGVLDEED